MTRVNVVPVEELSDQWLRAEYRELPRCIKQKINIDDAPQNYCLGKGHMKWAKHHTLFLLIRYCYICNEMAYRGFKVNYSSVELSLYSYNNCPPSVYNSYIVTEADITLNRQRLIERYNAKPEFYKWTNRNKPEWLQ